MAESRTTLRNALRERRRLLDGAARFNAACAVADHLQSIPAFVTARNVAGYWAVAGELPLAAVVSAIDRHAGQTFFLPVVSRDGPDLLTFAPWAVGDPVVPNRFGIPEPAAASPVQAIVLDVVLLPTIGFDRDGHRLGTGGGYYDRSLAFRQNAPAPPLLIGIAFACQQVDCIEAAAWDVNLDWVVTEREAIDCKRSGETTV